MARGHAPGGGGGSGPEPPTQRKTQGINNRTALKVGGVALAVLVVAIAALAVFGVFGNDDGNGDQEVLGKNSPALASAAADRTSPAKQAAAKRYLRQKGFQRKDYCFDICVKHVVDRQPGAVAEEALLTNEDLAQWLTSDSERAKATRERAKRVLSDRSYRRFLTGQDHVRVQFTTPITYPQNSAYADGQVVLVTGGREVGKGDILFVFVERKGKNKKGKPKYEGNGDGNVRGDCGNAHAEPAKIGPPGSPPSKRPPGERPPTERPPEERPPDEGHLEKQEVSIPGADSDPHGTGHGNDLPPDKERGYQGPPPRQKQPNPPVKTPAGTGGEIKPGESPPPNDSEGGTVKPPTAPPSPQPSLPPSKTPPPPPEEGAPPPPEQEAPAAPKSGSTTSSAEEE